MILSDYPDIYVVIVGLPNAHLQLVARKAVVGYKICIIHVFACAMSSSQ